VGDVVSLLTPAQFVVILERNKAVFTIRISIQIKIGGLLILSVFHRNPFLRPDSSVLKLN